MGFLPHSFLLYNIVIVGPLIYYSVISKSTCNALSSSSSSPLDNALRCNRCTLKVAKQRGTVFGNVGKASLLCERVINWAFFFPLPSPLAAMQFVAQAINRFLHYQSSAVGCISFTISLHVHLPPWDTMAALCV